MAVLCNHQRAVPKTHDKSMATLQAKIDLKKEAVEKAEKEFKSAKKAHKNGGSETSKANLDKKKKAVERAMEQVMFNFDSLTRKKSWKNSWSFVYIFKLRRTPFILARFFT